MKRVVTGLLILFILLLGGSACSAAQEIRADDFLDCVSKHSTGDKIEKEQSLAIGESLNVAAPANVSKVVPSIVLHSRTGEPTRVRSYAIDFLLSIAIRLDGAKLLSSKSQEISSLIADADPGIQIVAVAITDFLIAKDVTNKQPYLSALAVVIKKPQTSQSMAVNMAGPLMVYAHNDPNATRAILAFLHRDDLTVSTRIAVVRSLPAFSRRSEEISRDLSRAFDDTDPRVRAAAVVAYVESNASDKVLHSTSVFNRLSKGHVENIAKDAHENPQVRELARQALAGQTSLNPNIDVAPDVSEKRF